MNAQRSEKCILIVDNTNNGIVCQVPSDEIANGLKLSDGNFQISTSLGAAALFENRYNDVRFHYQLTDKYELAELPSQFITETWINLRKLSLAKLRQLTLWEFRCKRKTNRVNDFFGTAHMSAFLWNELNKCDPANNYYSKGIIEWATINDIPADAAYSELLLKEQNRGMLYLKLHAIYDKYVYKISSAETEEAINTIANEAFNELGMG